MLDSKPRSPVSFQKNLLYQKWIPVLDPSNQTSKLCTIYNGPAPEKCESFVGYSAGYICSGPKKDPRPDFMYMFSPAARAWISTTHLTHKEMQMHLQYEISKKPALSQRPFPLLSKLKYDQHYGGQCPRVSAAGEVLSITARGLFQCRGTALWGTFPLRTCSAQSAEYTSVGLRRKVIEKSVWDP